MKLNAILFGVLVAQATCLAMEFKPTFFEDYQPQPTHLREHVRVKRVGPIIDKILGIAGETVLKVGTGLLGMKAGIQHGGEAGRILSNGDWDYGFIPGYDDRYYDPSYRNWYYGPSFAGGYGPGYGPGFGPGYGPSYYGPGQGYYGPGGNGYYGPGYANVPNNGANGPGNNGAYNGGYTGGCRTPQGTPC